MPTPITPPAPAPCTAPRMTILPDRAIAADDPPGYSPANTVPAGCHPLRPVPGPKPLFRRHSHKRQSLFR